MVGGEGEDAVEAGLAHPPGGRVDDPQESGLVPRVHAELQEGDDVAHLLAVEERHPAHHHVGDAVRPQLRLEGPELDLGPAEDGEVGGPRLVQPQELPDLLDRELGLRDLVLEAQEAHPLALSPRRLQGLLVAGGVLPDDGVGRVQDLAGGAVVGLQADDLGPLEIAGEAQDLADVGPPPAVDGLVVVAHHADVPVLAPDLLHDLVLGVVRVLVLVHQEVAVPLPVVRADVLVLAEEAHGLEQQVVEVEGARPGQELPVALPDRAHELVAAALALSQVRLRGLHPILGQGDPGQHRRGLHGGLVHAQLAHGRLHRALLVGGVADREPAGQAEDGAVLAQHPGAERVEGPHRDRRAPGRR